MNTYDPRGLSDFRTVTDARRKFDWSIETMFHCQSNFRNWVRDDVAMPLFEFKLKVCTRNQYSESSNPCIKNHSIWVHKFFCHFSCHTYNEFSLVPNVNRHPSDYPKQIIWESSGIDLLQDSLTRPWGTFGCSATWLFGKSNVVFGRMGKVKYA